MSSSNYNKPLIKWVGGKTQIVNKIIDLFPTKITNYRELFLGGGSVLIELLNRVTMEQIIITGSIYAYDINIALIHMYKNIQNNPNKLFTEIQKIIEIFNLITNNIVNRKPKNLDEAKTSKESFYYWIRSCYNKLTDAEKCNITGSAYFIFLNKTCFRGVYREGPNGFNVPYGHYKKPEIINLDHLLYISNLVQSVHFIHASFEQSFLEVETDDFIYLDPPYAPENCNSFVNYTKSGFKLEQHILLFDLCKECNFLMSNADVELVRTHFEDDIYKKQVILCKRTINSKNPGAKTNELLIWTH